MLEYKLNSIPEAVNLTLLRHIQIKALPWYVTILKLLEHSQQIIYKELKQFVQESVVGLSSNKYYESYIQFMYLIAIMNITTTSLLEIPPIMLCIQASGKPGC